MPPTDSALHDAKEIDLILEGDGKLCPLEIKKTATPDQCLTRGFGLIGTPKFQERNRNAKAALAKWVHPLGFITPSIFIAERESHMRNGN